jgi:hypothetical protein
MATVFNAFAPEDEEKDQQAQQQNGGSTSAPTVNPTVTNGQSATTSGGGGVSGPSSSGRFTNLQKYIKANADFKQDQGGLAGSISNNIQQSADQTKGQIDQAAQAFKNQANTAQASYVQPTQPNQPSLLQKATADPTAFLQNQQDVAALNAQRDAAYTGPNSLQDLEGKQNLGNLNTNVQNVKSQAEQTGTEAGRFNLLRQMFGKPSYTTGAQRLDNLVLQGNQDQAQKLQQTRQIGNQAARALDTTNAATQDQAKQYAAQADQIRNDTRSGLNNAVSDFDKSMNRRVLDAQTQQAHDYDQTLTNANNGQLSSGILHDLGIDDGANIYNVDLGKYINQSAITPTKQTIASDTDYARANALQQLLGGAADSDRSQILASYGDPSQADAYRTAQKYVTDPQGLANAIQAAKSQYESSAATPQTLMAQAQSALNGNLYVGGGIENAIKSGAASIRNLLQPAKDNPMLAGGYGLSPEQLSAVESMSDEDVLKNYGGMGQTYGALPQDYGPGRDYNWLLNQAASERGKLSDAQNQFNSIRNMFKVDRQAHANDVAQIPLQPNPDVPATQPSPLGVPAPIGRSI